MTDEDSEEVNLRHIDIITLLREREDFLAQIGILKQQLIEAGLTPFSPHTKSAPDLSRPKRFSLPACGTSESTLVAKRQGSCGDEVKRQSLSTYDKRSGTNDLGKQYEYVMCGYYAVRFATSDQVSDFEMTTNDEIYGDFDDIALKVKYIDGSTHKYLLQLKHTENKKSLTEKILGAEKKDFSLMKYLKTYQNLRERDDVSCILFTNRTAHFKELSRFPLHNLDVVVKEYRNVQYEQLLDTNHSHKRSVFQFGTDENEIGQFLDQFYLFANQSNVSKMKGLITAHLQQLLACDVYDTFIHFMKGWWCGNFILTKGDIIAKLAELAFSPSIRNVSFENSTDKSQLLEDVILKFDIALVRGVDSDVVGQIWTKSDELREVSLTALKYGLTNKGISNLEQLTPEQKSKALWYLNKVPLVVKVYESRREQVKCAVKLLERMTVKKKLIVIGEFNRDDFSNWRVFEDLSDLTNNEFYEIIVQKFQVSLQGREPIPLATLIVSPEKASIIKLKELVLMSQEPLLIGEKKIELPESYISRTVTTNFLNTEKVIQYCTTNNELVIIVNGSPPLHVPYLELTNYQDQPDISLLTAIKCSKIEFDTVCKNTTKKRVHVLKAFNEQSSILMMSSENSLKSDDLQAFRTPVHESEIHKIFDHSINVLCAQPGIGKSTMIKFLDNNCPSDHWSVRVNLRKFNSLLKEEPEEEEILAHFLELDGTLLDEIKTLFLENRKIYLFLDGLDEIESNCVDFALEYVNYVASTGVHVWISSRQNLQDVITTSLNVFPIDIQELNKVEQKEYLRERLETQYSPEEIDRISSEIFNSANVANSHNMLGIPLQLYIITENFLDDVELFNKLNEEIFVLTKMYNIFFDGKKKHLYEKVGIQYDQQLGFNFNLYLENYEIPALKCCLDDNTFQKLNLEADAKNLDFLEMIKDGGDKYGIISQVNNDRAVFTHQTYAEYFACLWLKKNFSKARLLKEEFNTDRYQNLKLIFDIMLAENNPLHLAVIYQNSEQVKKHLPNIASRDEGGRSALHLICSYGVKYYPLMLVPSVYSNHLFHDENQCIGETNNYREIFSTLAQCDPFETDQVFKWSSWDYCFNFGCLYPVEKFLEQYEDKIRIDFLLSRINSVSLMYYSSKLGYANLLKAVIKEVPTTIHFRIGELKLSFLHVAVKGVNGEPDVSDSIKIKVIKILIQNGIDINVRDNNGATPLHWAVAQGRYNLVKVLLDEGAEINAITTKEETIIHYALNDWEHPKEDTVDKNGTNVLHWACKEGDLNLTKRLIDRGFDLNVCNKLGESALHYAVQAWKPNLDIIKLLIDHGIDVNCVDSFGISPLHWAFDKGHYDVIGILHQKGANVTTITHEHKTILRQCYKPHKPNMYVVEMLMDYGFNVNIKSNDGTSILHWVSQKGHMGVIKLLIANGANINATTKNHETILHYASRGWNANLIPMFTDSGTDINAKDNNGTTALHLAAQRGHLEMIKIILKCGGNISAKTKHDETVLPFAVKTSEPHLEVIKFLIKKKIDVNSRDKDGVTALHWACERGYYDIVKFLLDEGADVNSMTNQKETPLHYTNPSSEMIQLLVENGVQVNASDVDGMTALHWASERGQFDLVKTLLKASADVNATTKDQETVLIYAVKQRKINIELIRLLVNTGACINAIDKNGMNALHWASESGHYDVVKLLIERGIDVNSCTKRNETTLHYASKSWNPNTEVIKRLVLSGVKINAQDDDGTTALHWAAKEGHYTNVEVLTDLGANVHDLSLNQETTLHFAAKAWKTNDSVLELLIDKGVDVNSVDKEGRTPLHYASEKGFYDNVRLLLEKGAIVDAATTTTDLTALHFAVYGGHVRIIKLLLEQGLNINKVDAKNVNLPLYFAVRNGNLKEELLVMMAATIHDKFPLLSWKRYSYQEVITYLQEAQPYLDPVPTMKNASTSMAEQRTNFLRACQNSVVDNVGHSMVWFRSILNTMICRRVKNEPRMPTFIVHYPVFSTDDLCQQQDVKMSLYD